MKYKSSMEHLYFTYILANEIGGTLYIGITNDLVYRVWQHKNKVVPGFTAEYTVDQLVYYEQHQYVRDAIRREKRLKKWPRKWKTQLIEEKNPDWNDLYIPLTTPCKNFNC